jgi:hypothetical protein
MAEADAKEGKGGKAERDLDDTSSDEESDDSSLEVISPSGTVTSPAGITLQLEGEATGTKESEAKAAEEVAVPAAGEAEPLVEPTGVPSA